MTKMVNEYINDYEVYLILFNGRISKDKYKFIFLECSPYLV